jgi:hypothetical protein
MLVHTQIGDLFSFEKHPPEQSENDHYDPEERHQAKDPAVPKQQDGAKYTQNPGDEYCDTKTEVRPHESAVPECTERAAHTGDGSSAS